jgi:hypothetical protein
MSFWKRDRSLSDQMRINKIERDRIRNAEKQAKVDRTNAQTRMREKNGGATIQLKFAEPVPTKKKGVVKRKKSCKK